MSRIINLSAKFMRENPNFMGKLTPKQQKIWFAPFLGLLNNFEPTPGEEFQVSLEEIRNFIGSTDVNKSLRQTIIKAFNTFESLYNNYEPENHTRPRPFYLDEIKKGVCYFRIGDPYIFAYLNMRGRQHFQIDLDEIASYKQGRNTKSRTIPLLWYCLSHRHLSKDGTHWEINFGDRQLKEALGLDALDYVYVPDGERDFYIDYTYFNEVKPPWDVWSSIMEKYNLSNNEVTPKYNAVKETISFNRFHFEKKVLLPAIEELNNGNMLQFLPQEVWKRSPSGEAATKVMSYIGKNYTESPGVLIDEFHIIDKNVLNFRKLQRGNQYTFWIKK